LMQRFGREANIRSSTLKTIWWVVGPEDGPLPSLSLTP
jgi:hypothetical protein